MIATTSPEEQTSSGAPSALLSIVPPLSAAEELERAKAEIATLHAERDKSRTEYNGLVTKLQDIESNAFAFTLANLEQGQVLSDSADKLKALCLSVGKRQEKGTFTLKLTVKPFKDALIVLAETKITEPKPEAQQSVFYANEDGALMRNDPKQQEFGFRRSTERV